MIHCLRERLAYLTSGASGFLVLAHNLVPSSLADWSSLVAILAGVCGAVLSIQQIIINAKRWNLRRKRK